MNLITTVILFGSSTSFIVFVCTRLICGRIRRLEAQQMLENELRIDLELGPAHGTNGLQPVAVAAIPTLKFNREAFGSIEDPQCSICLSEYEEKEVLRIMPKCSHSFHVSCIDIWLRKQATCPVCRLSLQEDSVGRRQVETATQSVAQSLDGSEITVEHSQQRLLPRVDRSEAENGRNQMHVDSISVDLESDSAVFREATRRA